MVAPLSFSGPWAASDGRILLLDPEIAPLGEDLAIAGDDRAEGEVALRRFLDRKPHEGGIVRLLGIVLGRGESWSGKRHRECAQCATQ
jgi:hypothetical protein